MDSTLPTPTILENPDFAFAEDLLASIEAEDAYAAADLGPPTLFPKSFAF